MNIGRQMLAVSIIFFASKFIIKRSFLKYTFFVLLAILFHYSAVVAIAFYPFGSQNNGVKKIIRAISIILPIVVVFFMRPLISFALNHLDFMEKKYAIYGDLVLDEMGVGLLFWGLLIMSLLFIFNYRVGNLKCSKNMRDFIFPITTYMPILFLLTYKLDNFAGRLSIYIAIFQIVFLSLLTTAGSWREEGLKFDYQLLPYLYAGAIFVSVLMKGGEGSIPYKLWTGM
jgi:hypothetical protein